MNSSKLLAGLLIYTYLATAGNNNNSSSIQTPSMVSDTNCYKTLFVNYEENNGNINCYKKSLPNDSSILIAQFDIIPLDVIWDTKEGISYFFTTKGIFRKNYIRNNSPLEKLSSSLPR